MSSPLGSSTDPTPYCGPAPDERDRRRAGPPPWAVLAAVGIAVVAVLAIVSWWYLVAPAPPPGARPYALGPFFPFGLLFAVLAAYFLVRVVFWTSDRGRRYTGRLYRYDRRAAAILAERYARGEIRWNQYRQMLRVLQPPP